MLNKPIKIGFVVTDIEEAVNYYTTILDCEVEVTYPTGGRLTNSYVFLKTETIIIELMPQRLMGDVPPGFHHLAFWSDDVQESLNTIEARGGKVLGPAFSAGVGGITLGDVLGPEGVLLRLFNR